MCGFGGTLVVVLGALQGCRLWSVCCKFRCPDFDGQRENRGKWMVAR